MCNYLITINLRCKNKAEKFYLNTNKNVNFEFLCENHNYIHGLIFNHSRVEITKEKYEKLVIIK